jgi:hypothetical protein
MGRILPRHNSIVNDTTPYAGYELSEVDVKQILDREGERRQRPGLADREAGRRRAVDREGERHQRPGLADREAGRRRAVDREGERRQRLGLADREAGRRQRPGLAD